MTVHKEGYSTLATTMIIGCIILVPIWIFSDISWVNILITSIFIIAFLFLARFFRLPSRDSIHKDHVIVSPADGKIVDIVEEHEGEYFKDKRLKISIFMSGFNVHANWIPASGTIRYVKYHAGMNLLAIHPKSSHLNERASVVIQKDGQELLVRQIAGVMARRVVTYPKIGDSVKTGDELGFNKLGSRHDIFLPPGTKINV